MNIKSNTKSESIIKKIEIPEFFKFKYNTRITMVLFCIIIGYFSFQWIGGVGLSFFILALSIALYKNFMHALIFWLGLNILLLSLMTVNFFVGKPITKTVETSKIEFVDASETIVVYAEKPFKKVLIFNKIASESYFTLKNENNLTILVDKVLTYDYFDELQDNNVEGIEKGYELRIKCSSGVLKDSSILKNETNLF